MKLKRSQKKYLPLIVGVVVVLFGVLAIYAGILSGESDLKEKSSQNQESEKKESQIGASEEPIDIPSDAPDFFGEIYTSINSKRQDLVASVVLEESQSWWISDDGWSILVPTKFTFVAKVTPIDSNPNKDVMLDISSKVGEIMKEKGFVLNEMNSSENIQDTKFYDYVRAYQRDDEKCLITASPDVGTSVEGTPFHSTFTLGCFDGAVFQTSYEEQIPFLKGLNDKNAVIRNIQVKGNMASMAINWRRTGAVAFMYRLGNEWKKIIIAQGVPSCSELEENKVPKEYWIDCFGAGGEIIKGNTGL